MQPLEQETEIQVLDEFVASGGQPRNSDAYTINGHPGDLYPCSDTYMMKVNCGSTYLLRIVNAALNENIFFGVAKHCFATLVDPLNYNLVDPQIRNTVSVPKNGWTAIRFRADNPGVWFMHCHYERHITWGMESVFIVRSGRNPTEHVIPPPPDMPPC